MVQIENLLTESDCTTAAMELALEYVRKTSELDENSTPEQYADALVTALPRIYSRLLDRREQST